MQLSLYISGICVLTICFHYADFVFYIFPLFHQQVLLVSCFRLICLSPFLSLWNWIHFILHFILLIWNALHQTVSCAKVFYFLNCLWLNVFTLSWVLFQALLMPISLLYVFYSRLYKVENVFEILNCYSCLTSVSLTFCMSNFSVLNIKSCFLKIHKCLRET